MTQRTGGGDRAPGEVGRPVRALDRPPAERYEAPSGASRPIAPDLARATFRGLTAALVVAVAWGVLLAILDLDLGLIAVAIIGGWVVGLAVASGAWRTAERAPSTAIRALASGLAASAWLGGWLIAYLISLAILPASVMTFDERLAAQPFVGWLSPQVGILDGVELTLLAVVAWRSAR